MSEFGKELKMYARIGLRSSADWLSKGRQVTEGSILRAEAVSRGARVELFGKDQTQPRPARAERTGAPAQSNS